MSLTQDKANIRLKQMLCIEKNRGKTFQRKVSTKEDLCWLDYQTKDQTILNLDIEASFDKNWSPHH